MNVREVMKPHSIVTNREILDRLKELAYVNKCSMSDMLEALMEYYEKEDFLNENSV